MFAIKTSLSDSLGSSDDYAQHMAVFEEIAKQSLSKPGDPAFS